MKLRTTLLAVGLVGMLVAAATSLMAAEGAATPPKQLLEEAKKLYAAHNYEAAIKRLQQVDRNTLGFFEKGRYDSLLQKTQKAAEAKPSDERALADGKDALAKKRYATAVEKLSQAASSDYLEDDKSGVAKGLLQVAQDDHAKAVEQAKTFLAQAARAQKEGKADEARQLAKDVEGMDVRLDAAQRKTLADLNTSLASAPTKSPEKGPTVMAAPAAPAATGAKEVLRQARDLYAAGRFDDAQKQLAKVRRDDLGFFDKFAYDGLMKDVPKAIDGRAAGEKALADGKDALAKKKFTAAVASLSQAASSDYLAADQREAAKTALQTAEDEHGKAVGDVKALMAQARSALGSGRAADARKALDGAKAVDVDLGWWGKRDLAKLEKDVQAGGVTAVASTVPAKAPEKAPATVAVAQAPEKGPAPVVAKPAEKGPAPVVAKPPAKGPAPVIPATGALTLAEQARRAEAEEQAKLGKEAAAQQEYEKARIRFARALELWPDLAEAKEGLDHAMKLLGEREEPPIAVVRDVRALERQRIIASVQELLAQAEREMGRAERPEDYTEALRPLSQADRTIDVARVLSAEEQERLREEVFVLRKEIQTRKGQAEGERAEKARREAETQEIKRREADRLDRSNKIRQLWDRTTELRKAMKFGEAIEVLDRLLVVDPNDERAVRWRDDLLYLEAQDRQVKVRSAREAGAVEAMTDNEEAAIIPGDFVRGRLTLLRYPDAKDWKGLSKWRAEFTKAVTAEPKAVAETRRRLSEEIDLDFEKTSLDNVLKYIGEVQKGLNIVIDPDVATEGVDLTTRVVDLKVKRVSVESVLGLILGADLGYKVESGYILVTTAKKLQENLPMVTYPVQDLVAVIPDFAGQAPRFEVGDVTQAAASGAGGGGGGFGNLFGAATTTPTDQPVGYTELIDIIQRTVNNRDDPKNIAAWADEGGPAAIEYMNGLLIVTQTRKGHEKVASLLEQLRRERAIMISVEARFCQVSDQFLQDITLDVDAAFLDNRRFQSGANPIANPNPYPTAATLPPYDTLPGTGVAGAPALFGQPIIVSSTGSNLMGTSKLIPLSGTAFANFGANEGGMSISGVFLDDVQVGFLLRAIQADVRSTQLQAPRITLYNGQTSYISVATVVTYIADIQPVVAEAAVGWDPTIGAIPVGATLDVKATVSADRRYVQMDLRPQVADALRPFRFQPVSAAVPGAGIAVANIELPEVSVQDFKTTVSVPDGGTLLLGGTRRYNESEAETGVPILSKIPILKRLFNNRATLRTATNLLILVKPKIIIQAEEESNQMGYDDF